MAEDLGDKTEAPTPRRRQEARDQGNIARSADLTSAVLLLGMLMLLNWYGKGVVEALRSVMDRSLGRQSMADFSVNSTVHGAGKAFLQVGQSMLPLLAGAVIIAVLINIAQVGWVLNLKRLQPNLGALNPLRGLGRLFKKQGWVQLLINFAKLVLVTWVAWSAVSGKLDQIIAAQSLSFMQIFLLGSSVIYSIGIRIGVVLLILAIIDYAWQKWRTEQELKMTKQEVKEEMKRMEGDPKIKNRRRQFAMQMHVQRIRKDVPTADVVVTNPTHFAVALKYDSATMTAPRVVAKGQDYLAQRIREVAIESGIAILERPPLARALYAGCEVGQEIPEEFYAAVAEILAYVYEISGKARRPVAAS